MALQTDTVIGNKRPSAKLKGMLVDLVNDAEAIFDRVQKVREQAHNEGFNDYEAELLLKSFLEKGLGKAKAKYILYDKPRAERQKILTNNIAEKRQIEDKNIIEDTPEIPAPDYNIVVPDQILEEETKQFQQEQEDTKSVNEVFEKLKPNYGEEELRAELEDTKKQLAQEREDRRQAEEKIEQLEAKTRGVSPTNNFPALQGNILRTRIVVNPLFREVIGLKGSKTIYANIIIDMSQNKYIRLEPL